MTDSMPGVRAPSAESLADQRVMQKWLELSVEVTRSHPSLWPLLNEMHEHYVARLSEQRTRVTAGLPLGS